MVKIAKTSELPTIKIWWTDSADNLIDFSGGGFTFSFKVGYKGQAGLVTKTSGITGAAGSGTKPSGVPNIVITPAADWFATIPKGAGYTGQVTATTGGLDRIYQFPVEIVDIIT